MSFAIVAALGFTVGVIATWVFGRRIVSPPAEKRQPERDQRLVASEPQPAPEILAAPTDLRHASEQAWLHDARAADRRLIEAALVDARDALSADEAIFWRWIEARDALAPEAWSNADAQRPFHFDIARWASLVQWSAQQRIVQVDASGERPLIAAAPIIVDDQLAGVLSITRQSGLARREATRAVVLREAAQFSRLLATIESRLESRRRARQARALLAAVQQVQSAASADALGRSICATVLEVSSTRASALVRWNASAGTATVQASVGFDSALPAEIDGRSVVGIACHDGIPVVRQSAVGLFADKSVALSGSCAVIPIVREFVVLGAIVVLADSTDPIAADEVENIRVLGVAATAALESAWRIEEVELRARTDPLTSLANRRHLEERLATALAETDRFNTPTSLIMVDIDHFKRVNDTWGHEAGDHVLQRVARGLADAVRTVDTCARFGGEEIALLLPQTPLVGAVELAERLRKSIAERPVYYHGTEIPVTASLGVACYPDTAATHDALLTAADRALYEAKASGRNNVKSAPLRPRSAAR